MMMSGTLFPTSVWNKQNPIPLLEESVSSCIVNFGLKCLRTGHTGFVMISFTLLSAASCMLLQNLLEN